MTLLSLLVLVVVLCLVIWIINLIPLPTGAPPYLKNVLYILVAIVCIFWLLNLGGFLSSGVRLR